MSSSAVDDDQDQSSSSGAQHQRHHFGQSRFLPLQALPTDDAPIPQFPDPRKRAGFVPSILRRNSSSASMHNYGSIDNTGVRRASATSLKKPNLRSHRLIGLNSNPRYRWAQYIKTGEELKEMKKPMRQYYERNNKLATTYIWADNLLNGSIVPKLLDTYTYGAIPENRVVSNDDLETGGELPLLRQPFRRPPGYVQKMGVDEETHLLEGAKWGTDECGEGLANIVQYAIYVNFIANAVLLAAKIVLVMLTSSLSVVAALLDSALDFLSTAIVWTTTYLISRKDNYKYPIGRRKLEPVGVLVFSVIMISTFCQVAIEGIQRLAGKDRSIVELSGSAIGVMTATIVVKGGCWLWCRMIKNSSVQALAQDAVTDVYFNFFAIVFPLIAWTTEKWWNWGLWWLDPLGGLLLSLAVIIQWSSTSSEHIRNLTGAAASQDERNLILYVCMRFASTIKKVTSLQAYHAGDLLNVEVEILLDENVPLRDSHDIGEALQFVIESIPIVDRAFVHLDYSSENPYGHLDR